MTNKKSTTSVQQVTNETSVTTKTGLSVEFGELPAENTEKRLRVKSNGITAQVLSLRNNPGSFIKEARRNDGGRNSKNHWQIVNAAKKNGFKLRSYISKIGDAEYDVFVYAGEVESK